MLKEQLFIETVIILLEAKPTAKIQICLISPISAKIKEQIKAEISGTNITIKEVQLDLDFD